MVVYARNAQVIPLTSNSRGVSISSCEAKLPEVVTPSLAPQYSSEARTPFSPLSSV